MKSRSILLALGAILFITAWASAAEMYLAKSHWRDGRTCITAVVYGEDVLGDINNVSISAHVSVFRKYVPEGSKKDFCEASKYEESEVWSKDVKVEPEVSITPCIFDPETEKWYRGLKIYFCADWQNDVYDMWKRYLSRWIPPGEEGIVLYDQRWYDTPDSGKDHESRDICDALTETGEYVENDKYEIRVGDSTLTLTATGEYSLTPISKGCPLMGTLKKLAVPTKGPLTVSYAKTWFIDELSATAPYIATKKGESMWCVTAIGEVQGECAYSGAKCYNPEGFKYKTPDGSVWYKSEIPIDKSEKAEQWCKDHGGRVEHGHVKEGFSAPVAQEFCSSEPGCHQIGIETNDFEFSHEVSAKYVLGADPKDVEGLSDYTDEVAPKEAHCEVKGKTFKGGYLCIDEGKDFAILSKKYYEINEIPVCPYLQYASECAKLEREITNYACNPGKQKEIQTELMDKCGKVAEAKCDNPNVEDCKTYFPYIEESDWNAVMKKCIEYDDFREYLIDYLQKHGDDELSWAIYRLIKEYNAMFDIRLEVVDGKIRLYIDGKEITNADRGVVDTLIGDVQYDENGIYIVDENATAKYVGDSMEIRGGVVYVNDVPVTKSPSDVKATVEESSGKVKELLLKAADNGPEYEVQLDNGKIIRMDAETGENMQENREEKGGIDWMTIVVALIVIGGIGAFVASKKGYI